MTNAASPPAALRPGAPAADAPYPRNGPESLRAPIEGALRGVDAARSPEHAAHMRKAIVALVLVALLCLVAGLCGGLLRAGVALPAAVSGAWLGAAVQAHAFLMICAFMGTVIGIERAVAVKAAAAFAAPVFSAAAGLAVLAGAPDVAAWLAVLGAAAFVAVTVLVVRRQRAAHTVLLLVGACAWLAGNLGFAFNGSAPATVPWWFAFLVLTVVAERLDMTRPTRRRPGASEALYVMVGTLLAGCALFAVSLKWAELLYGTALLLLAAWLLCFDIARRTLFAEGLSRYMAICLLLGDIWLAVAGISWCALAFGMPLIDAAIHALALGFVLSMVLGHAPVILPALAGIKVAFGWPFYLPLALLHLSLAARLLLRHRDLDGFSTAAAANALAIVLFAITVAGAALAWRLRHGSPLRTVA